MASMAIALITMQQLIMILFIFLSIFTFIYVAPNPIQIYKKNNGKLCGTPDTFDTIQRSKRSPIIDLGRLSGKSIRYRIAQYPLINCEKIINKQLSREYINNALRNAIKLWGKAIDVNFIYWPYSQSDIEVSFASFDHGDQYPFDGIGGEVAHAFYPIHEKRRGQIHIDEHEPWGPNGRNLNWVLAHEVGHTLGLPHTLRDSIMMPQYQGYENNEPSLSPYDIESIQALYGKKENWDELAFKEDQQTEATIPSLCDDQPIDALFALPNGTLFVFKGEYFWRLSNSSKIPHIGPLFIKEYWGAMETPIDTAFTDQFDWTWFVKDDRAWRIDASTDTFRYSSFQNIHETEPFATYPYNSVDAVLITTGSDDYQPFFFFLGPKYWSDGNADGEPDQGYTRQIKEIDVELSKVDGAISLPTGNFIFSDDKYWKVQSARSSLQKEKDYPRSIKEDWFHCF